MSLHTEPFEEVRQIKGISFPGYVNFRKLLITGPPGSGKSTMVRKLGGWSEEGYVDLSMNKWWTAQSLALRPREIHLGFPFKGVAKALAVFDKAWIEADPPLELDYERFKLPPKKRYFFSVNWYKRYIFDFILPPAEILYERRIARGKEGTHHVDRQINLQEIQQQLITFQLVALFLHQQGFSVYIRENFDGLPMRITDVEQSVQLAGIAESLYGKISE